MSENPPYEVKRDLIYYDLTFDNINQKIGVRQKESSFKHGANIRNIGESRK